MRHIVTFCLFLSMPGGGYLHEVDVWHPVLRVVETHDVVAFLEVNLHADRLLVFPITGWGMDGLDEFAVYLD